jgi:hypothetical protein
MRCYLLTHAFEDALPLRDTVIVFLRDWISHTVLSDDFALSRMLRC